MGTTFNKGGIHPAENKTAADIEDVELPNEVTLLLSQHIGAPAKAAVSKGDRVRRGDMVATACGVVSACVHTPISGVVTKVDRSLTPYGYMADSITVKADEADHCDDEVRRKNVEPCRSIDELDGLDGERIRAMVADAGIVGLGGAAFPTHVKLAVPKGLKADVLIVNGAECEPYLTADDAIMRLCPDEIMGGIKLLMRAVDVKRAIVGIEENKPDAIVAMKRAAACCGVDVTVVPLKVKYPQGGEKQLIFALTGREVPSGGLPVSVGAVVQNVATARAVYRAALYGEPLMERVVTVAGTARPGNYRVPVGMGINELLEVAGGIPADTGKIVIGGPMMGKAIETIYAPLTKGSSGILVILEREASRQAVMPCIRCGACVEACPMGLEPYLISTLSRLRMFDEAEEQKVTNCIECGSCSYVCPAARPLLDYVRYGKATVAERIRQRKKKCEDK